MTALRRALACAATITSVLGAQSRPVATTALVGVTVVDVESGALLPNQTVLLRGDRIAGVYSSGSHAPERGVRTIDARGRFVIPGLWDMHTHIATGPWYTSGSNKDSASNLALRYFKSILIATGVTGIRDVGGDAALLLRADSPGAAAGSRDEWPRILFTGEKLGARPVVPGAPFPVRNRRDVEESVRLLKAAGASHVKLAPEVPTWLIAAASSACIANDIPCVSHAPSRMPLEDMARLGVRSIEHLFELPENTSTARLDELQELAWEVEHPTIWQRVLYKLRLRSHPWEAPTVRAMATHDEARARRLFRYLASSGTWVTPTLLLHDLLIRSNPTSSYGRDTLLMIEPPTDGLRREVRTPSQLAIARSQWRLQQRFVRELRDAGVGLLAGTDSPLQCVPGFALHLELEMLQDAGLSPLQALQSATINPARYLHGTDSLGAVRSGMLADLVLLRRNPLDDVRRIREIEMVVSRGKVLSRADLDVLLERSREALRALTALERTRRTFVDSSAGEAASRVRP